MNTYSGRNAPLLKNVRGGRAPVSTSGFPAVGNGLGGAPRRKPWLIEHLFRKGEQGALYDPSVLTSGFQERTGAAATTPSAVGGVVGTKLDLSGNANHATSPSDAARPLLGREPEGGRRNLLLASEAFDNAAWTKTEQSITANCCTAPDGTQTADRITKIVVGYRGAIQNVTIANNSDTYTFTVYLKKDPEATAFQEIGLDMTGGTTELQHRRLLDVRTGDTINRPSFAVGTASVAEVGDYYKVTITVQNNSTGNTTAIMQVNAAIGSTQWTLSSAAEGSCVVWGAQLELGSTATPYQRVGASSLDVTEAGKRNCFYLFHDLSDDVLQATLPDLGQNVTIATGDNDGGTITANQTVGAGVRNLPNTKSRLFAHLLIYKSLTLFAKDFVNRWLLQKSGKAP
jgi:hypothetical protein